MRRHVAMLIFDAVEVLDFAAAAAATMRYMEYGWFAQAP
jgi:hypothetical protein